MTIHTSEVVEVYRMLGSTGILSQETTGAKHYQLVHLFTVLLY